MRTLNRIFWRPWGVTGASLVCVLVLVELCRQACADYLARSGSLSTFGTAIAMMPARADLYRALAFLDLQQTELYLRTALDRNPIDGQAWLQLGLLAEANGREAEAEQALLTAFRCDASFRMRWTLCNYYYRNGNEKEFWRWAQRAAAVPGDLPALIELCWRQSSNDVSMVRKILPSDCKTTLEVQRFLIENRLLHEALPVARELTACSEMPALLDYVDRSIFSDWPGDAREIWNLMSAKRLIPHVAMGTEENLITNGDFSHSPSRRGFDWRLEKTDGVAMEPTLTPPSLRIQFSGKEPATTSLLGQILLLEKDRDYELSFVKTIDAAEKDGLHWRLGDLRTGAPLVPDSPDLTQLPTVANVSRWQFRSPTASPVLLLLYYNRPTGQRKMEGLVSVGNVILRARQS